MIRQPRPTRRLMQPLASAALLAAGLLLPSGLLPAARGADEPPAPTTRPDAANRPGRAAAGGLLLERLHSTVTGLDLTDEQKPKIEAEFDKARKAMEELGNNPPAESAREGPAKVLSDLRSGVAGILTEDQKKAMREKLQQGGTGRTAGPLAVIRENMGKLGLSDEQKSKADAILKDNQEKIVAIIRDAQGDRQAIGEKIRPIIEENRQKMLDVLTDEQKAKLKELMPEQGRRGGAEPTTKKTD